MLTEKSKIKRKLTIGIDASRNRSGGAIAHLIGILSNVDPDLYNIQKIHVWSFKSLLDRLPEHSWLIKHNPVELEKSLFRQLLWQALCLSKEALSNRCNILFTTDASSLCYFKPMVVLSQDMLSYEPGVMKHFGFTLARLRLLTILFLQNRAMQRANGVIFLNQYAEKVIKDHTGELNNVTHIPHGVDDTFKKLTPKNIWYSSKDYEVQCLYISNTAMYKHQWTVVKAISALRNLGYKLRLTLAGGGKGKAQKKLEKELSFTDPDAIFVHQTGFVPHTKIASLLEKTDIFIFASSCENMPVTLIEAMSVGLPIACSNRGPMPSVLGDGGIYFDPENFRSIASAVKKIVDNNQLRSRIARNAKKKAMQYTWNMCADETFNFIVNTYRRIEQ